MGVVTLIKGSHGKIAVTFPYSPDFVAKVKGIPGHRWHPGDKSWRFPNTNEILEKILKAFEGEEININMNINMNLGLPPGIDPAKLPQNFQQIVQQLIGQIAQAIPQIVQQEIVRQSPIVGIDGRTFSGQWKEKIDS